MTALADPFVAALEIADAPPGWNVAAARAALERARANRDALVLASLAPSTLADYARDWRGFVRWCAAHAIADPTVRPLPASDETLSLWLGAQRTLHPSTLRRRLAAVRLVHRWAERPLVDTALPRTLAALRGHVREHGSAPRRQARAATGERIARLADACDVATPLGLRNRALLLVGFDAALRSDELVGLDHAHLTRRPGGIALELPRAKTDPSGHGATVALHARPGSPWCPVAALERWIAASGRSHGAVFVALRRARGHAGAAELGRLSKRAVARVVRASAQAAGLVSSDAPNPFSGHSLRRGQITTALDDGAALDAVMRHARHRSPRSTLRYREIGDAEAVQPVASIGPRAPEDAGGTTERTPPARPVALPISGADGAHESATTADLGVDDGMPCDDPECAA